MTDAATDNSLQTFATQTVDRYLPGLMALIYGPNPPDEAILEIESEPHRSP